MSKNQDDVLFINIFIENEKGSNMLEAIKIPISEWPDGNNIKKEEIDIILKKKKVGTLTFETIRIHPTFDQIIKFKLKARESKGEIIINLKLECGVGKTELLRRFVDDQFTDMGMGTIILDCKTKSIDFDSKRLKLHITDAAGQERNVNNIIPFFQHMDGFIVVFDIIYKKSFIKISKWIETLKYCKVEEIPTILVGCKTDFEDRRQVTFEEANSFAIQNSWMYFETSAKLNKGVNEAFQCIISKAYNSLTS